MSESGACLNAKLCLREVLPLKEAFNRAYDAALISRDVSDIKAAHHQKRLLEEKVRELKEMVWPVELRKQYDGQLKVLNCLNILKTKKEKDANGNDQEIVYMHGIDGWEHPLPSFQEIFKHITEKQAFFSKKMEQGFTKLLLVPFGMSSSLLMDQLRDYITKYRLSINKEVVNGRTTPVWDTCKDDGDVTGDRRYNPYLQTRGEAALGGYTKKQILDNERKRNDWHQGWRVLFVQTDPDGNGIAQIAAKGNEMITEMEYERKGITSGESAYKYFSDMIADNKNFHSPYCGEGGLTVEDWVIAFVTQFEEAGVPLDSLEENGARAMTHLTGSFAPVENNDSIPGFFVAGWEDSQCHAIIGGLDINSKEPLIGIRTAVAV